MKAKNLETGNIANVGPKFLVQQSKPFISSKGKIYPDGVWVAYNDPPMSKEATEVIKKAAAPAAKKQDTGIDPVTKPKAEELEVKKEA